MYKKKTLNLLRLVAYYKQIGFIHRDIKPPNFAIGRPDEKLLSTIFILDFGLSRKYMFVLLGLLKCFFKL